MESLAKKMHMAALVIFVLIEIATWFYLPDKEYFFLLWTFLSLIGLIMAFKRERWWFRFLPRRVAGEHIPVPEVKETPDLDYTTAQEQGMGVDAARQTKEKNPFEVPRKPKAVRLGMVGIFALNVIGLIAVTIYLY